MRSDIHRRFLAHNQESGSALIGVFLLLVVLATLGASSLFLSRLDLTSTNHFSTGRQAFFAAESGVLHALSAINSRGVQNFQTDILPTADWTTLYGSATKTIPSDTQSKYTVTVAADPADPVNRGIINATGLAPLQARRVLRVRLRKGEIADQGALYMAADNVDSEFGARDQFEIDGNNHKLDIAPDGSIDFPVDSSGPVRPGIATRNDAVSNDVKASLSTPQKKKITGQGFTLDPLNPSVVTTGGPTVPDLERIVQNILASNPVTTVGNSVLAAGQYGTIEHPQVTHLTNKKVRLDGNMTGVGVLIADGEFTINGSANFIGWMIIRGATILQSKGVEDTLVDGNATIVGSLWTGDLIVQVGGSAIIDFCLECMNLANGTGNPNNVPRSMQVASWQEVL